MRLQREPTPSLALVLAFFVTSAFADEQSDPDQVERGRRALLEQSHLGPMWGVDAYEDLWRNWADERPAEYATAVRERYGLHPAPYENNGYPMGIRLTQRDGRRGLALDCMLCHGGSIAGASYVGLGNTTLDLEALLHDLTLADGRIDIPPGFVYNTTRGTANAGAISERLIALRNPDLSIRLLPRFLADAPGSDADVPAWWLLHRKRTMYVDGSVDVRSVRSNMQFLMGKNSGEAIRALEPAFADIRAYLLSLRPPPYPFAIDAERAETGRGVFEHRCAKCHGTYGDGGDYPNQIVPLETIGTDAFRLTSVSSWFRAYFNETWFAENWQMDEDPVGYQAPPLNGVWASAPYLHNGSVPTVYGVLNPAARPRFFRRLAGTAAETYDPVQLGWRVVELPKGRPADDHTHDALEDDLARRRRQADSALERREVFDTTMPGKSNQGHPFGLPLSEDERTAVIEYLKTL
jgi:cytochrome c5